VLASVLLVVAVGCIAVGLRGHQVSLALPHRPEHPASPLAAASTTAPAPLRVVARSTPVTLSIPAIGVAVAVSELGLNPDGTVQVPTDFQVPGWYRLGPSPGQVGSAVILGHVDSYQGPAVFFNLRSLTAGDPVDVTLADGVIVHFVVTSVAMYPKDQFPAQQVYGSHGNSQLQLVTCGGTFDSQTGHYLSNIVVYSSFVTTTPATAQAHL
jgi:sortase (surface protein transpeptidase)